MASLPLKWVSGVLGSGTGGWVLQVAEAVPEGAEAEHVTDLVQRREVQNVCGQVLRVEPHGPDVRQPGCAIRLRGTGKAGSCAPRGSAQVLEVDVDQQIVDVGAEWRPDFLALPLRGSNDLSAGGPVFSDDAFPVSGRTLDDVLGSDQRNSLAHVAHLDVEGVVLGAEQPHRNGVLA